MTGNRQTRFRSQLRWFPMSWRVRYGEELVTLMEDTYGDQQQPLRDRLGVAVAGLGERLRTFGFGGQVDPDTRARGGALLVLCGWAFYVVGGIGFAKIAEHWDAATPVHQQRLPADAYHVVVWAASLAAAILGVAALTVLPAVLRYFRSGGWKTVRRWVGAACTVTLLTALAGTGLVLWAHRLTSAQRNGQSSGYGLGATALAVLVVVTIASWVVAAIVTAPRVEWTARVIRFEGGLALGMTTAMIAILGGTAAWWAAEAAHAPGFLAEAITGTSGSTTPPALVAVGICMLAGLALALTGSWWVARAADRKA